MTPKILLATDGRDGALGAGRVALRLAQRDDAQVEVIAVYEPMDLYVAGSASEVAAFPPHYVPAAIEAVGERVRSQLQGLDPRAAAWPVKVEVGRVARTIARAAASRESTLIVTGLHQPGGVERWISRETLLRLIHLASAPVLAVPEGATDLPRTAVIAMDFSDFSMHAAREAVRHMRPGGKLYLVHVSWPLSGVETASESAEWVGTYRRGVRQRLQEVAAGLLGSTEHTVEVHVREGEPAAEVLRLAEEVGADLIATGSHGSGFFGRLVLGSVSSTIVHRAGCALLVAPPRAMPAELHGTLQASPTTADEASRRRSPPATAMGMSEAHRNE
jgi:nucleotide-binding universal stress UspA family protein